MSNIRKLLLDVLFPPRCVSCGVGGQLLCSNCRESIRRVALPICEKCGRPLRFGRLCESCSKTPLTIDGVRAVVVYGGAIRDAIHAMKYRGIKAIAPDLSRIMFEYLQSYPLPADVLLPVPLHRKREQKRGFNQSALLARELGLQTGLELVEKCLVRVKHSGAQALSSTLDERRANVNAAFECLDERIRGRRVLLIDDVCTTRSTLEACCRPLKAAGALSVWGLTLATEGQASSVEKRSGLR